MSGGCVDAVFFNLMFSNLMFFKLLMLSFVLCVVGAFLFMRSQTAFRVIGTQSNGDLLPREPRAIGNLEEAFGWARAALNIPVQDGVFS